MFSFFFSILTKPRLLIFVAVCVMIIFVAHPSVSGTQQAIEEQRPRVTHYMDQAGDFVMKVSEPLRHQLGWN